MDNTSLDLGTAKPLVYVGQEFKNFKDYCDYFNISAPKNPCRNTRNSILKKSAEFFVLEKQGHKLIVREIIKQPVIKDQLRLDKDLLDELIENQLLLLFKNSKSRTLYFWKKELWEKLGLINHNYITDNYESIKEKACKAQINGLEKWMFNHFLYRTYRINDDKLKQTLGHLKKRGLLCFSEVLFKVDLKGKHSIVESGEEMSFILDCRINAKNDVVGRFKTNTNGELIFDENGNKIETTFQDIHQNWANYSRYIKYLEEELSQKNIKYTYNKYKITICGERNINAAYENNLISLCKRVNRIIKNLIDKNAEKEQLGKYPRCKNYDDLQKWLSSQLIYLNLDCEVNEDDKDIYCVVEDNLDIYELLDELPWKKKSANTV